ncbi:MAG: hypothetical protein ACJAT8_000505 [Cellvibrionaceae bacterium]|jgi:hypothetical protein
MLTTNFKSQVRPQISVNLLNRHKRDIEYRRLCRCLTTPLTTRLNTHLSILASVSFLI